MSNTAVGQIYSKIVQQVIEASQHDFAEEGVESAMLEALREKWQARLSAVHVAQFPWDPAPQPSGSQATASSSTVEPSTFQSTPSEPSPRPHTQFRVSDAGSVQATTSTTVSAATSATATPSIKQEPNYETKPAFLPQLPQTNGYQNSSQHNPALAQQRTQNLLAQKFGSQAGGSIAALQARHGQMPQGIQLPQGQRLPQAGQQQGQAGQQQQSTIKIAQTDGAGDVDPQWTELLQSQRAQTDDGPMGRVAIDGYIRQQVQEMSLRLEGGGLLETMEERERRFGKRRKVAQQPHKTIASSSEPTVPSAASELDQLSGSTSTTTAKSPTLARKSIGQYDGADSDDDEDAINSDLDDPADIVGEDEEIDTEFGDYILCTYDKVQRVKNKWKCTLKDGVLHAGGKDYVFHKAQGEFEW